MLKSEAWAGRTAAGTPSSSGGGFAETRVESRRSTVALLTGFVSLTLSLLLTEVSLRYLGKGPWRPVHALRSERDRYLPNAVLGWRNHPGVYRSQARAPETAPVRTTIWSDGSRATGPFQRKGIDEVLLLGCSFTFGEELSDEDTLGWALQDLLRERSVRNLAVSAYGTLQSLMALEQRLRGSGPAPVVVYGLMDFHQVRNVADPGWLRLLAAASGNLKLSVPFVTLDSPGRLVRHPPVRHPMWPLRYRLAIVSFLQDSVADLTGAWRVRQEQAVESALLVEMDTLVRSSGGKLLVSLFAGQPEMKRFYAQLFSERKISFVDCGPAISSIPVAQAFTPRGHPTGVVDRVWATCLAEALRGKGFVDGSSNGELAESPIAP